MAKQNKDIIPIILVVLIIALAASIYFIYAKSNNYIIDDQSSNGSIKETDTVKYFEGRIINLAIKDVGQPIEGFDANLLIAAYPGLTKSDFDEVEALEGKYQFRDEELIFIRTEDAPVSSAERMVIDAGYKNLLKNVSSRLNISIDSTSDVDMLIELINTSETIDTRIGQGTSMFGVKIIPLEVIEDSRCPIDVTCIQAGTVIVKTNVTVEKNGEIEQVFELDRIVEINDNLSATLTRVEPQKEEGVEISNSEYIFYFKVDKK